MVSLEIKVEKLGFGYGNIYLYFNNSDGHIQLELVMTQIVKLAKVFSEYKIYPAQCFNNTSIVHIFQHTHPFDHYAENLKKVFEFRH